MISYFIPNMPTADALLPYLKEIDRNRWYSNFGPLSQTLTKRLANECFDDIDPKRLSLVSSGTNAIELALKSLDLPKGGKVLTPAFTFPATIEAIINAGLTPLICDIDEHEWQLTASIAQRYTNLHKIAAIVPVASFGMPVNSGEWAAFSQTENVPVVVDAAPALINQQIHDALTYAFSLHATKPLGAGEGGLVVSRSPEQAEVIRKHTNFGFDSDRTIILSGTNAKMSEYHCAVGLAQLDRLPEIKAQSAKIVAAYKKAIFKHRLSIATQPDLGKYTPSSLYVTINHLDGNQLFDALLENGIETRRLYWPLIQDMPAFRHNCLKASLDTPNAYRISSKGFALPFHSFLSETEIEQVVQRLDNLLKQNLQHKKI